MSSELSDDPEICSFTSDFSVISSLINTAESIRRDISADSINISDSVSELDLAYEQVNEGGSEKKPALDKRKIQLARATANVALSGFRSSVAYENVRRANISDDHSGVFPLSSKREYHDISGEDVVSLLSRESPGSFVAFAADILSPIRNEHTTLSEGALSEIASLIASRQEEIGPLSTVLFANCWRIAHQNGSQKVVQEIESILPETSSLRHFMRLYEKHEPKVFDAETLRSNSEKYTNEYIASGGKLEELEEDGETAPKVRMRMKPEALWSIAMRDGGFIRSGDEGASRDSGRGYTGGDYASIRNMVESYLYGDTASDQVQSTPIVYGYYADDESSQTEAMKSMSRIYGGIELIFKDDLPVDTRVIYGDSMNAIALKRQELNVDYVTSEDVSGALDDRIISKNDAVKMSKVISKLHGDEENTEFNPSANPYVECVLRGRLNLADCQEIRVPSDIYEGNVQLMKQIEEMYGIQITKA